MPFTLAHPAAAVPLRGLLGKAGVLSALVIGSMAPDFPYFVPGAGEDLAPGIREYIGVDVRELFSRQQTHSLSGLFWFCLPAGLAVWLVFHLFLKRPLVELCPRWVAKRIFPLVAQRPRLPAVSPLAVVLSILIGAVTHLAWDQFTHPGTAAVRTIPALGQTLFTLAGYQVHVHSLLQVGCTLLGMVLLTLWSWQWLRRAPACEQSPFALPAWVRRSSVVVILGLSAAAALMMAIDQMAQGIDGPALQGFAVGTAIGATSTFCAGLLAFSLAWHILVPIRQPAAQEQPEMEPAQR